MKVSNIILAVSSLLLIAPAAWSQQDSVAAELQQELLNETQGPVQVRDLSQAQPRKARGARADRNLQQQPTTYVQASPLEASRAEQLRRQRQDAELATEQKIVEKLEHSRLEDEKRRANALFGDRMGTLKAPQPAADPYNNPASQYSQQQQAIVVPYQNEASDLQKEEANIKEEVVDAVREELKAIKEVEDVEEDRYFVTVAIGGSEYPDEPNVSSNSAMGFGFGVELPNQQMVLEGHFVYSDYYVRELYKFSELEQYNFDFSVKYAFLRGRIRPVVGAVVGFVHRKYQDINPSYWSRYRNSDTTTDSFDVGGVIGLDLEVTDTFLVGIDFKYMTNITSRSDSDFFRSDFFDNRTPVEEMNYYNFGINGKVRF